ncbi:uroporphyrinogen-III synthase [Novosphingobium beihaiensis]|uniref:Uroporphyrinogen-III synthase n=1 Tax=Novosphingobium beihaiensis TaxID=2930389 RepID=A0ABT0BVC4_9SPHN|nr:uroporphyrinogen-III synthase [Novosphingobium beihaiensis]MCJ2188987.1 uroporphyrinogen-III synthase [Novosphingobium beihaiensis]
MALPVLVLRPEPGAAVTVEQARAMGLDAHAFPLFAVRPLPWQPVPREDVDALLLGSANALRHGGGALALYRELPAYAVGEKTAEAAREAGLNVIATGKGGLQPLLDQLRPGHRRLLRLAGRERVDLAIPAGIAMITREVYASEALPMPPCLATRLAAPALVLLHSGEAAAYFAQLCRTAAIDHGKVRIAAIGPRVAARAGSGWAALRNADRPSDAALLALAAQMCEEAGSGSQSQRPEQG